MNAIIRKRIMRNGTGYYQWFEDDTGFWGQRITRAEYERYANYAKKHGMVVRIGSNPEKNVPEEIEYRN